jgi:acetyl-CoA synthetase
MTSNIADPPSLGEIDSTSTVDQRAAALVAQAQEQLGGVSPFTPEDVWSMLHRNILTPEIPFAVHQKCYQMVYSSNENDDNKRDRPLEIRPCWLPDASNVRKTNVERMMEQQDHASFAELYEWSVSDRNAFWMASTDAVGIQWHTRPSCALLSDKDDEASYYAPTYFPDGKLNIADSCFGKGRSSNDNAIIFANETDPTLLQSWTEAELQSLTQQVAHGIRTTLELAPGAKIAMCLPMTPESVAIYLGILSAGGVVVSIADSFSVPEIATRCRIAGVQACFTQDVVYRHETAIPLAERVWQAERVLREESDEGKESKLEEAVQYCNAMKVVVLPAGLHLGRYDDIKRDTVRLHESIQLRPGLDFSWLDFLQESADPEVLESVPCHSMDPCNILFSSGTTGDPKAVVWSHSTPIKCCVDGFYHQDIQEHDRIAWPTNIGWMMGPWLLFQRIHGATICLYQGLPHTPLFCKFIETAQVTLLGVIPSLVKAWHARGSPDDCDWSRIRRFSSTGEASDSDNYHWLMSRVPGYAPVIEYCGGTEIGGSFLSSTMIHPNVPSMFANPVLGSSIRLLDPDVQKVIPESAFGAGPVGAASGELVLHPPSVGWSTVLLNRNHFDCYFADMPCDPQGRRYRRHGDAMEVVRDHDGSRPYFRALGRCDDTMNLGGIKVSSVEIERVCNTVPIIKETAAIAVSTGGPCQLVMYVVLHGDDTTTVCLSELKASMQRSIKTGLNPLFGINDVVITDSLPRTASNKVMRRLLRDEYIAKVTVSVQA